jgi:heat shock protein HslJ
MKNLHIKIIVGFLFLTFIMLMSCTSSKENIQQTTQKTPLISTYWKLTEMDGKQVTVIEGMNEPYILLSAENLVKGNTGCNTLFGKFSSSNDILTFSEISSTKMACFEPEISNVEIKLLNVLKTAANYKLTGEQLELYNNNKLLARLTAKK